MSGTTAWLLLATSVWIAPAPAVAPAPIAAPDSRPVGTATSRAGAARPLRAVLAVAVAAGCAAVLGPVGGSLAACLVLPIAVWVIGRLERRAARCVPDRALALTLDLLAAALHSGQPVSAALALAAPAAGRVRHGQLSQVAGLLRLGADPTEAWRTMADDDVLAPVAQAACRSAHSGIRLALGMEQVAAEVRAQVRAAAEARAQRAGVLAMAPLGLCFLPAFVCLGVVPVVVGIATGVLRTLP